MKKIFLSVRASFLFAASLLVVGTINPIHSLLALRSVIFRGSALLFSLSLEYFGLLFLIVYVGAIVVLFLFVVRMLEIKIINTSTAFQELFSVRGLVVAFLLILFLSFLSEDFSTSRAFFSSKFITFETREFNLYLDYSALIYRADQLRGLGALLFTEYKLTLIITGVLLFLARVGAIVLSLDAGLVAAIKTQDANNQARRNPVLSTQGFRYLKKA